MAAQFKNRLVGTIVLVALLVIVIPDLLDGEKERVKETFNAIPFAPQPADLPPLVIELDPKPIDETTELLDDTQELAEAAPVVVEIEPTQPSKAQHQQKTQQLKAKTTTVEKPAWIIQLASFKSAERTNALVSQLRKAGYQAHSYPSPPVDNGLNRVFVGPDVSKEVMIKRMAELKKLTKLEGMLRKFDALSRY